MKKISEEEVLWNKIKEKHVRLIGEFNDLGKRNIKMYEEMKDFLIKIKSADEAAHQDGESDEKSRQDAEIIWKRLEPVYSYFSNFLSRQTAYHITPEMLEYGETLRHGFGKRIAETKNRIHSNNLSSSHSLKLLMAYDKELDGLIEQFRGYEKVSNEAISEFEDIKRVAALEEN